MDNTMTILSPAGLHLIRVSECVGGVPNLEAYQDDAGVWTQYFGHTHGVKKGDKGTPADAEECLLWDVSNAEATLRRFVGATKLLAFPQGAIDALGDATFNLGVALWLNKNHTPTGLARAVAAGRHQDVPPELRKWTHSAGHVDKGLTTRRESECAMWSAAWAGR